LTETKRRNKKQKTTLSDSNPIVHKTAGAPRREIGEPEAAPKVSMDLFILRHGEAGNRTTIVEEDSERPLTPDGRSEMFKIAKSLKAAGLRANRVYTSPLRRARETAEIAAKILKIPSLEDWDELKPDGNKDLLYRKLARTEQNSRPILVGHEPFLTSMIAEIIGDTKSRLVLKKGGLGKVRIDSFTPQISGELRWLVTPKMIIRMS
jgi:phosphohistidine phosphatase